MSAHKFTYYCHNGGEDVMTYLLDGESLVTVSHDLHGWVGVELAQSLIRDIAGTLGIDVEEIDNPEGVDPD